MNHFGELSSLPFPLISFFKFRLWEYTSKPARQSFASEERVFGHERVPAATLLTVPDKGHKPIYCHAAAAATTGHGGKSHHDGKPGWYGQHR